MLNTIELEEGDIVIAVSDGVTDNLWGHEIMENVLESIEKWETGDVGNMPTTIVTTAGGVAAGEQEASSDLADCMVFAARRLLNAALTIAMDPFADSPYMEKAIDEGLTIEGGMYLLILDLVRRY